MSVKIRKSRALGELSLTPMVDVVFLLLIFFLVATRFAEAEREEERQLDVLLPEASEAMPLVSKPKELFVNIDQQGRIIIGRKQLSQSQLLQTFQQAWANNPGRQTVIIRADKRCVWEHVVVVMNLCNKAHIRDYRVTTAKLSE